MDKSFPEENVTLKGVEILNRVRKPLDEVQLQVLNEVIYCDLY
jgi:hypothetical protein